MKVSVVIPTLNEQALIGPMLERSVAELAALGLAGNYEIVVVDNASTDRSAAIVKDFASTHPEVSLVVHTRNLGYAASNLTGFHSARGDVVVVVDGDGQLTLRDLAAFLDRIAEGADVVYGWRRRRRDPAMRVVISFFLNALSRLWLGWPHHDINCGYRAVTRRVAEAVTAARPCNFFGPELWVRARQHGWRVAEVEVEHFPREGGQSIHALSRLPRSIWAGVSYMWSLRQELRGTGRG